MISIFPAHYLAEYFAEALQVFAAFSLFYFTRHARPTAVQRRCTEGEQTTPENTQIDGGSPGERQRVRERHTERGYSGHRWMYGRRLTWRWTDRQQIVGGRRCDVVRSASRSVGPAGINLITEFADNFLTAVPTGRRQRQQHAVVLSAPP